MNETGFESLCIEIKEIFGIKTLEWEIFLYVFKRLHDLGDDLDNLTLNGASSALNLDTKEKKESVAKVFDFLACQQKPLLERRFELWDLENNDFLDQPICELSGKDVRAALENNSLLNNAPAKSWWVCVSGLKVQQKHVGFNDV